jgi:ribosome-binding protein aMBF1 (putative translation factor)
MKKKKKTTTDALAIMDALWGKTPGWKEGIDRERQKFALGEVIRKAREARGWTQKQLARKAGTSQSYISRIEDADYDRLMIATLDKLAKTLDLPLTITLGSQTVQLQPA